MQFLLKSILPVAITFSVMVVFALPVASLNAQDKLTGTQNRKLKSIQNSISRAGKLYENEALDKSANLLVKASDDLKQLVGDEPSAAMLQAASPVHEQLKQGREVLVAAGKTIPVIAALPQVPVDENAPVSFKTEIATILNTNCGNCHVQRSRGQLSMATFNDLAKGLDGAPVVVPGKADESHLIEMIEDGSMPPNGSMPEKDLARLKKWITDGANFDGEDRDANVGEMAAAAMQAAGGNQGRRRVQIDRPSGGETVSFSLDIAPALMTSCVGCHYEAQNARGGLRIDNMRQLLRGGDSGPMVIAGDSENSPLIQRLTATDNTRMPRGRPALDAALIAKIKTWIDEGAKFDGRRGQMNLRLVAAIASAEVATHEEMTATRTENVMKTWKKVMSDIQPQTGVGANVLVIGQEGNEKVEELKQATDLIAEKIKQAMDIKKDQPLVKGLVTVYVFDRRYDYAEFGKMVEQRELPKSWQSHWGFDTVDAYSVINLNGVEVADLRPELTQRMASIAAASLGKDAPAWFSGGMGYMIAESVMDNKKLTLEWQTQAQEVVDKMENANAFLGPQMAEDQAVLAGYLFLNGLRNNTPDEYRQFIQLMKDGETFAAAFQTAWSATPQEVVAKVTGQPQRPRGQGNRRNRRRNQNN